MTNKLMNLYCWAAVVLTGLLLVVGVSFSADRSYVRKGGDSFHITELESSRIEDDTVWNGEKIEYRFQVPALDYEVRDIAVYTVHQDIRVFLDGELLYARNVSKENLFGSTPGCLWHFASLAPEDMGKTVMLEVTSPYKSNLEIVPEVYVGSRSRIYAMLLFRSSFPLLIGFITAAFGIGFIIYAHTLGKRGHTQKGLGYLGIFALNIGIWQVSEVFAAVAITDASIGISYVSYISLLLLTIPFIMFVRELYSNRDSKIWDFICICSLIQITVEVFCLITGVADFKQMLWSNTILYGMGILTSIFMVFKEKRTVGLSTELKRNFICLLVCGAAIILDFVRYFMHNGDCISFFGTTSFLIYIIFVGTQCIKEANRLIEQGREAGRFKRMAYHDSLTGTLSRAAFEEAIEKQEKEREGCIIVMFDLNDLKKCNDTLGHKAGDKYIKESAELICRMFQKWGKCYRIGGDEFCVLIAAGSIQALADTEKKLNQELNRYNEVQKGFERFIACGYAQFDAKLDADLNDTRGRADAAMYRNKFQMKKETN